MCMGNQGENSIHNFPPFCRFRFEMQHYLSKIQKTRFQEEVCGSQGKFALDLNFNAFTYLSLANAWKASWRFTVEINRKGETISCPVYHNSVKDFSRGLLKLNCFAFAYDQPEGKNKYWFNHIMKAYQASSDYLPRYSQYCRKIIVASPDTMPDVPQHF